MFAYALLEVLRKRLGRISRSLRRLLIEISGLVALVSPFLLWISYTPEGYVIVLLIAIVSVGLIALLIWSSPDEFI